MIIIYLITSIILQVITVICIITLVSVARTTAQVLLLRESNKNEAERKPDVEHLKRADAIIRRRLDTKKDGCCKEEK